MAAKKKAPAKKAAAKKKPAAEKSVTGVELINGHPFFAVHNGVRMNRREWLDATRPERQKKLAGDLRKLAEELKADEAAD